VAEDEGLSVNPLWRAVMLILFGSVKGASNRTGPKDGEARRVDRLPGAVNLNQK